MRGEEPKNIKIQIYNDLIGNHSYEFNEKSHMNEIRTYFMQNSPLALYQNFHFELNNVRLYEFNQLSDVLKSDNRFQVVFDPYDYFSAKHHLHQVKEIIKDPVQWAILNSKQLISKPLDQDQQMRPSYTLQKMFQKPFSSKFLEGELLKTDFGNFINISGFNPVPSYRKFQGDLFYLYVHSLQEIDYHITASTDGFYVNTSTQNNFNPNPHPKFATQISLLDLLMQISPQFKALFQDIQKKARVSQFQKIFYSFKPITDHFVWLKDGQTLRRKKDWKNDCSIEQQNSDFTIVKEWIQIFQMYKFNPSDSFFDKMNKQKIRYKICQEFIDCAKQGVTKIFSGLIEPLKKAKKIEHQVYYNCNLLFYFAGQGSSFSQSEVYRDLINVSQAEYIDLEDVYLSSMVLVNYRGYKIVVRTVPSSFIHSNLDLDSIKSIFEQNNHLPGNQSLANAVKKICKHLMVQSQTPGLTSFKDKINFVAHPSIKGFLSKDSKKILFNLSRICAKDINFQKQITFLRPQLMKIYNQKQKCQILYNPLAGQLELPNIQKIKLQERKLVSVAKFAKVIVVGTVVDSFDNQMRKYLSDSQGVIANLHKHGLSSEYLGLIYKKAIEKDAANVKIIIERVILVISAKKLFKKAMRNTLPLSHRTLIKQFFNYLFDCSSADDEHQSLSLKKQKSKKKEKEKKRQPETFFQVTISKSTDNYLSMSQQSFWKELKNISEHFFDHNLSEQTDLFKIQFSKTAVLRDLCLCLGLEIEKKNYFQNQKIGFKQENIVSMIPRVKFILNQPRQLLQMIEEGDQFANKYQLEEAFQVYNRALQYLFTSFNGIHQKLALINKKLAIIYYKIGDIQTALLFALNSCEIYQTLLGHQHVYTLQIYMMISVYHFIRKKYSSAQWYLLKSIFLAKWAYSQCYPELLVMYLNLSTIYETQKKYLDAIVSVIMALNICIKIYGEKHQHTAIIYATLASIHFQIPDIDQASKYQLKTVQILSQVFGSEDQRVIEAKILHQSYKNVQSGRRIKQVHQKQQKYAMNMQNLSKFNFKMPFYDSKDRPGDFLYKKNKKMKYFF